MDEVLKVNKKLNRILGRDTKDIDSIKKCLNYLMDFDMSFEILRDSKIGMTINNLRREVQHPDVCTLSKSLIKRWKKLLPDGKEETQETEKKLQGKRSPDDNSSNGSIEGVPDKKPKQEDIPEGPILKATISETTDKVRLKCREMLAEAIELETVPSGSYDPAYLAADLETHIFDQFKNTDIKYKNKIRSRIMNLKDKNNPNLRINLLMGHLKPSKLAFMSAEEMASEEMKKIREVYTKQGIDDHQMATNSGCETDLLKCGKCKKNRCTYNQMQTRSADEPMTTFVLCNNCGHRWKFC